jgi:hypothetical protein
MAPELHVRGVYDAKKVDIFAIGVSLLIIAIARLPF